MSLLCRALQQGLLARFSATDLCHPGIRKKIDFICLWYPWQPAQGHRVGFCSCSPPGPRGTWWCAIYSFNHCYSYSLVQSWNAFPPRTIWWGSPPRAEKRKMYHIIRSFDKVWKGRLRRCGRRFRRSASSITLLHLKTESETPFSYTCMSTPDEDAFFVPE